MTVCRFLTDHRIVFDSYQVIIVLLWKEKIY